MHVTPVRFRPWRARDVTTVNASQETDTTGMLSVAASAA
jgi:hypothetical protein